MADRPKPYRGSHTKRLWGTFFTGARAEWSETSPWSLRVRALVQYGLVRHQRNRLLSNKFSIIDLLRTIVDETVLLHQLHITHKLFTCLILLLVAFLVKKKKKKVKQRRQGEESFLIYCGFPTKFLHTRNELLLWQQAERTSSGTNLSKGNKEIEGTRESEGGGGGGWQILMEDKTFLLFDWHQSHSLSLAWKAHKAHIKHTYLLNGGQVHRSLNNVVVVRHVFGRHGLVERPRLSTQPRTSSSTNRQTLTS